MKICYITHHGYADCSSFENNKDGILTLIFDLEEDGAVTLGTGFYAVKGGEASIPLGALPDGEYSPRLETDSGSYLLEGFTKHLGEISVNKISDKRIRRLISECRDLEITNDQLNERICRLEQLCSGHRIFNSERKEK